MVLNTYIMKKSTILKFLEILYGNLKCCFFSKTTVYKLNYLKFDFRNPMDYQVKLGDTQRNLLRYAIMVSLIFTGFTSWSQIVVDGNPTEWPSTLNDPTNLKKAFRHDAFNANGTDDQWTRGSQDPDPYPAIDWNWVLGNSNDKGDIGNAGAILIGTKLFFFGDRAAVNGAAQIGFWFFLGGVKPSGNGLSSSPFEGEHTNGDLLIISNFTNGGGNAAPLVYMWKNKTTSSPGGLVLISASIVNAEIKTNTQLRNVPNTLMYNGETWSFDPKSGAAGTYPVPLFFEGSVDLATIDNSSLCFQQFLLETRNSQSLNASLQDFVAGGFSGVPSPPKPSANPICYGEKATLTATGCSGTLKWYSADGKTLLQTGGTSYETPLLTVDTSYSVSCTVDNCESPKAPVKVTVNPKPTVTVNSPMICASDKTAQITATPSPAGTYTYMWTVPATAIDPGDVASFLASVAGDYSVLITDGTSSKCTGTGKGTLTINPNPTVTVNSPTICSSDKTAQITATPNPAGTYTYKWTVPATASDPGNVASFSASVAGEYSVVITDGTSTKCTGTGKGMLTINPNPTVTVNSPTICVSDKTAKISATPNPAGTYTYKWTVPATADDPGNAASFDATVAGEYSVVITDETSTKCTGTGKGTLTINPLPAITCPAPESAQVICGLSSSEAQASANAAFAIWFAQFASKNPDFVPVVDYVYDPIGAKPTTGTAPVIPIIGTPALASPTSVTVTWTITDGNGCKNSCSATYSQEYNCAISCNITEITNSKCNGDNSGSFKVSASGGTPPYIIYLYNSSDLINPIKISDPINTNPAEYTFSGLGKGDYVTESTDSIVLKGSGEACPASIGEPDAVTLVISSKNVTCNGIADGKLAIDSYSGTGTAVISLSKDGGVFTEISESEIETASYGPGKYEIKVCYPDGNGVVGVCCLTKSTTIIEPALVSVKISGTNVTCNGKGDGTLSIVNYSGDGIPTFYLKKDAGSFVETTKDAIESGSYDPGTYTIKVAFSDGNNPPGSGVCESAEDKVIIEPSSVTLVISSKNVTCNGIADGKLSIDSFSGDGSPSFYLKIGAGEEILTTKEAIVAGSYGPETYYIRVSYPDGNNPPGTGTCSETKSIEINQPDAVLAKDESTKANCIDGKDGTVTLTFSGGTPPYMVNFNDGGFATQTSPITYSGLAVGTYKWIVKDANECSVPGSEEVGFIPCVKALCTYTQGYYGNIRGMSCADGIKYTTTALITKALEYYSGKMIVGFGTNTVSISTPSCVIAVLPGGGGSYKLSGANNICSLPSSYLKNGRINNTLLAQTITLGLNIGINSALGDFALQAVTLATAMPDGGCGSQIPMPRTCTFDVYTPTINEYKYYTIPAVVVLLPTPTVQGLFDMANKALGGEVLPAGITLSNLASAVDIINNAFDGCRIDMGYDQKPLVCLADRAAFIVSPNPILDFATITYQFNYISDVTIQVWSTGGSLLYTQLDTNSISCLGKQVKITYPFTTSGSYIIKLITNIGSSSQTVLK